MSSVIEVLALGLAAGTLTTLTGAGGGVFLIVALSLLQGPHVALAASAPTLLVGNLHRVWLYRAQVDGKTARSVILGALPASVLCGLLAVSLPPLVLQAMFLGVTGFAVARAMGRLRWSPRATLLTPYGAVVGGMSATSGGAGLLMAPLLLSTGLSGKPYVATSAAIALATHVGRLSAYGARGLMTPAVVTVALSATVAVVAGNVLGDRVRGYFDAERTRRLELATLALSSALALATLAG